MTCAFPRPGDRFAHDYTIVREIGRGGFARVYLGVQERLDRPVAIKVVDPQLIASETRDSNADAGPDDRSDERQEMIDRFKLEARLVSQLRTPHVVTLHDFGESEDGLLYMVMEYIDGVSFDELDKPMPAKRVINIMRQALLGLSEAHRAGVLHRDLKPANLVLFDQNGVRDRVKLLDFGVAKLVDGSHPAKRRDLTRKNVAIGTPRYMSPEQVMGYPLDARSDIYGFGLVVYELLTARRAIELEDPIQILAAQVSHGSFALPADADIPSGLRRVVDKMLQKDPDKRYVSTSAILRDLDRLDENGQSRQTLAFGRRSPKPFEVLPPRYLGMLATAALVIGLTALFVAGSGGEAHSDQMPDTYQPPQIAGQPVDFTEYRRHAELQRVKTALAAQRDATATRKQAERIDARPATEETSFAASEPQQRRHKTHRRAPSRARFEFQPLE